MIQFLVTKIFEKTKQIIEQIDDDKFLQNILRGVVTTPLEEQDFLFRYFPDSTEELFQGQSDLKKQYVVSLKEFFDEKRRIGGGGAEGMAFVRRLLVPTRAEENAPFAYTRENTEQWTHFALRVAVDMKGPTATSIRTKTGGVEVVSNHDLQEAKRDPKQREALENTVRKTDGKFEVVQTYADGTEKSEFLSETELEMKMQAQLREKVQLELERAGFFISDLEVVEEFGEMKIRGRGRDHYGKEAVFETREEETTAPKQYVFYDVEKPDVRVSLREFELSDINQQGVAFILERRGRSLPRFPAKTIMAPSSLPQRQAGGSIETQFSSIQKAKQAMAEKKRYTPPVAPQAFIPPQFAPPGPQTAAAVPRQKPKNTGKRIIAAVALGGAGFAAATFGPAFFFNLS